MSGFIRPEARARLAENSGLLIRAAFFAIGGLLVWRGLGGAPVLVAIGGAIIAVTAVLYVAQRQRAGFLRATSEPGVVEVDEARISYFGPDTGGIVDRDALARVDLVSHGDGLAHWRLVQAGVPPVSIPLAAAGADALLDVLMTLPGVEIGPALSALDRKRKAIVPVWSRTAP